MSRQPMQPIVVDSIGHYRFKENHIVRRLLDAGGISLNDIATWNMSNGDKKQFAQLIGYSLSGYGELSYIKDEDYETAYQVATTGLDEEEVKLLVLERKLEEIRKKLKGLIGIIGGTYVA